MNTNSVTFFKKQEEITIPEDCELILAVWEIVNPENAGKTIRLGHNIGARKVLFINKEINFRESKIKKTAGFSFKQMEWKFISARDFNLLTKENYKLVVLETCEGASNIFATKLPPKTILLAGSESHGIPTDIIEKSDIQTYIPMPGGCKSMNVTHALSVASFEWFRQVSG